MIKKVFILSLLMATSHNLLGMTGMGPIKLKQTKLQFDALLKAPIIDNGALSPAARNLLEDTSIPTTLNQLKISDPTAAKDYARRIEKRKKMILEAQKKLSAAQSERKESAAQANFAETRYRLTPGQLQADAAKRTADEKAAEEAARVAAQEAARAEQAAHAARQEEEKKVAALAEAEAKAKATADAERRAQEEKAQADAAANAAAAEAGNAAERARTQERIAASAATTTQANAAASAAAQEAKKKADVADQARLDAERAAAEAAQASDEKNEAEKEVRAADEDVQSAEDVADEAKLESELAADEADQKRRAAEQPKKQSQAFPLIPINQPRPGTTTVGLRSAEQVQEERKQAAAAPGIEEEIEREPLMRGEVIAETPVTQIAAPLVPLPVRLGRLEEFLQPSAPQQQLKAGVSQAEEREAAVESARRTREAEKAAEEAKASTSAQPWVSRLEGVGYMPEPKIDDLRKKQIDVKTLPSPVEVATPTAEETEAQRSDIRAMMSRRGATSAAAAAVPELGEGKRSGEHKEAAEPTETSGAAAALSQPELKGLEEEVQSIYGTSLKEASAAIRNATENLKELDKAITKRTITDQQRVEYIKKSDEAIKRSEEAMARFVDFCEVNELDCKAKSEILSKLLDNLRAERTRLAGPIH